MNRYALAGAVLLIGGFALLADAAAQTKFARELMASVYQQDTSRDMTLRITMQVGSRGGAIQQKKFVLYRLGAPGDSRTLARFTDPLEMKGVVLLSINRKAEADRQFIYLPATQRVRPVAQRDRAEPFAGSDFTYEDIAERVLDDFTYRYLKDEDVIEGHKTFKVEATPAAVGLSQYGFTYYWVAQDVPVILYAELYDKQGQLLRRYHASQLKHVSGIWGARKIEMSLAKGDTKSTFTIDAAHFNTGLSEEMFKPESLDKLDAFLKKHPSK